MLKDLLLPFADLGTEPPLIEKTNDGETMSFIRNGELHEISLTNSGVIDRCETSVSSYTHINALLASASFADLGRWADSQNLYLDSKVQEENIRLIGTLEGSTLSGDVHFFDKALSSMREGDKQPRSAVALIDGPAGIGKTSIIRSLSYHRAINYRVSQKPLILHVESRGRILQNITDLMAFSLQTLRTRVLYDQVPVLVKQGLIVLAIDGFDELGDPNGYEFAWAQVNDLVADARGGGTIILAGRETFLSGNRLRSALKSYDAAQDEMITFTLENIQPAIAKQWLKTRGWDDAQLDSEAAKPLFAAGSYALRPFFLSELAQDNVASQIVNGDIDDLLAFLIDAMINREATKFGRDVEVVSDQQQLEKFTRKLMEEVARDLAENQTNTISEDSLVWMTEIVATGIVPDSIIGILKNRASVMAFLTLDDRRGYRRFVHEQVANYFLSQATIGLIHSGEIPKYIRRNIFGPDFLTSFADVFRFLSDEDADRFYSEAQRLCARVGRSDRSRRNLSSLIFVASGVLPASFAIEIADISFEEVIFVETPSNLSIRKCTFAQMQVRGADLRKILFDNECHIVTLICDDATIVPQTMPIPSHIASTKGAITAPVGVRKWLLDHSDNKMKPLSLDVKSLKGWGIFDLMQRVARYKPFWLREGDDRAGRRIISDPLWPVLRDILLRHDYLVERTDVPASGRRSLFYHIKRKEQLMSLELMGPRLLMDVLEATLDLHE